jgi:transposase
MKKIFSSTTWFYGVDVAKNELVIAQYDNSAVTCLVNKKADIVRWLKQLPKHCVIALESTGAYHQLVLTLAHAASHSCYLINPKDLRHYRQSLGKRGKTDAVDAHVIARYVQREHHDLHLWEPSSAPLAMLAKLLTRRANVVETIQSLRLSFEGMIGQAKPAITSLRKLTATLEATINAAVKAIPDGDDARTRLLAIPGIGPVSSAFLVSLFSRIRFENSDAVVAYSGLDPRPNQSGQKTGKRCLSKRGPAPLRVAMFMAAKSGMMTATWKPFYEQARAKGHSGTAAIVMLARRMLRVAYQVFKSKQGFDAARLGSKAHRIGLIEAPPNAL